MDDSTVQLSFEDQNLHETAAVDTDQMVPIKEESSRVGRKRTFSSKEKAHTKREA